MDHPRPPFAEQQQKMPGSTGLMQPVPDHGETSYRGSGRLAVPLSLLIARLGPPGLVAAALGLAFDLLGSRSSAPARDKTSGTRGSRGVRSTKAAPAARQARALGRNNRNP